MRPEAWIEEKGLAVAVHTRRLEDPEAAYERLLPVLAEAAKSHDLDVEPGRNVIEVRAHGMHKGAGLHRSSSRRSAPGRSRSSATTSATSRPSRPSRSCAAEGLPGLLVCSASEEQSALADLADLVVDGPEGVLDLLRRLTHDIRGHVPDSSLLRSETQDFREARHRVSYGGIDVHILRRLPRLGTAHREGLRETAR